MADWLTGWLSSVASMRCFLMLLRKSDSGNGIQKWQNEHDVATWVAWIKYNQDHHHHTFTHYHHHHGQGSVTHWKSFKIDCCCWLFLCQSRQIIFIKMKKAKRTHNRLSANSIIRQLDHSEGNHAKLATTNYHTTRPILHRSKALETTWMLNGWITGSCFVSAAVAVASSRVESTFKLLQSVLFLATEFWKSDSQTCYR